ncbi:MAG: hypothetical protein HZA48_00705 [Planctomycetes bacterium]|nr:hypothetical protein [Planctomycetota bacterium]
MYELLEDIPAEKQDEVLAKLAKAIVERGLTTPAILALESHKPLSFFGSTFMHMTHPFVNALFSAQIPLLSLPPFVKFTAEDYRIFAFMLEKRENVEKLLCKIEQYDIEFSAKIGEQKNKKQEVEI